MKTLLIVFAKNVVPGRVKTRLARKAGDKWAIAIYRKLLQFTNSVATKVETDRQIWYDEYIPGKPVFSPSKFDPFVQQGQDLGERMRYAFEQAFAGKYRRVVIIGTDCADLTPAIIEQAFEYLEQAPVVIGPATDGGYYLIGMNRFLPSLFEDKSWSTGKLYDETIKDLKRRNLRWIELPELNDVDRWSDWKEVSDRFELNSVQNDS